MMHGHRCPVRILVCKIDSALYRLYTHRDDRRRSLPGHPRPTDRQSLYGRLAVLPSFVWQHATRIVQARAPRARALGRAFEPFDPLGQISEAERTKPESHTSTGSTCTGSSAGRHEPEIVGNSV